MQQHHSHSLWYRVMRNWRLQIHVYINSHNTRTNLIKINRRLISSCSMNGRGANEFSCHLWILLLGMDERTCVRGLCALLLIYYICITRCILKYDMRVVNEEVSVVLKRSNQVPSSRYKVLGMALPEKPMFHAWSPKRAIPSWLRFAPADNKRATLCFLLPFLFYFIISRCILCSELDIYSNLEIKFCESIFDLRTKLVRMRFVCLAIS